MAVFSVLAVMMMLMSGCSAAGLERTVEKAVEINQSVSFPDQYSITYQVLNSDGTITTVSKAKDTSGSIYYRSGETEKLYVCVSSNHFNLYEKDDSGEFKLVSDWEGYTSVYIREETKPFTEYAETSKKKNLPTVRNTGESEIAGRTCNSYEIKTGVGNFVVTYTFQVDQETGICLGWQESSMVGKISTGDASSFTCVDFQTENIILPAYS